MSKNLYMHTIAGKPAMYVPNNQIVYFNRYHTVSFDEVFVNSLEKIKQQQNASRKWRKKQGFNGALPDNYGYIRITKAN
jgi:hypothetical protein